MLAWVHASLASEQEFLVSLFGDDGQQAALERQGSASTAGAAAQQQAEGGGAAGAPDGAPTIPQLLDSVFESICRPLRVRSCCCVFCLCDLKYPDVEWSVGSFCRSVVDCAPVALLSMALPTLY